MIYQLWPLVGDISLKSQLLQGLCIAFKYRLHEKVLSQSFLGGLSQNKNSGKDMHYILNVYHLYI